MLRLCNVHSKAGKYTTSETNTKLISRWESERKLFWRWRRTCTTNYDRLAHKFHHNVNRKPNIKTRKATVKRNLNN